MSAKSALSKAVASTLNHWGGLTAFMEDGQIEVDSNIVERSMKSISLTRKNTLFVGNADGGQAFAILASCINTCKLSGVDPEAWLADVLGKVISGKVTVDRLDTLFPWV